MIGLGLAMAVASSSAAYDCVLDPPSRAPMVTEHGVASAGLSVDHLALGDLKFRVVRRDGPPQIAVLEWAKDLFHLAGSFPVFTTSKSSFAFLTVRRSPCTFTEGTCLSLIHLVDQSPTSAKILITPAGLINDAANHAMIPFVPVITGKCSRSPLTK